MSQYLISMRRSAFILGVCLVMPLAAHAATAAELQQQIQQLISQLQTLQQQTPGNTMVTSSSLTGGGLSLPRDLERGARGQDVSALQSFFSRDPNIYPEAQVSGYFGPLTERAVQRFQVACGIVSNGNYQSTGYGRVGPLTRRALSIGCAAAGLNVPSEASGLLKVTPVSGGAPLTVSAEATVNAGGACTGGQYVLDFGDGSMPTTVTVPVNTCAPVVRVVSHTYNAQGVYHVSLGVGAHKTTVQVVVSGVNPNPTPNGTQDRITTTVASGPAPLATAFTAHINAASSCAQGTYTLDFGDGTTPAAFVYPANSCSSRDFSVPHTYTNPGTYTAKLYNVPQGNMYTTSPVATVIVTVSAGSNTPQGTLSATPVSGSAPLSVAFTSTVARSYSGGVRLDFGDGANQTVCPAGSTSCSVANHTYQSAGTYIAALIGVESSSMTLATSTITISGPSSSFTLQPYADNNPAKVIAAFNIPSSCSGYTLTWGDGQTETRVSAMGGSCSTTQVPISSPHTYAANGTYTITLRIDSGAAQTATIAISGI